MYIYQIRSALRIVKHNSMLVFLLTLKSHHSLSSHFCICTPGSYRRISQSFFMQRQVRVLSFGFEFWFQYIPAAEDSVIGVITERHAEASFWYLIYSSFSLL